MQSHCTRPTPVGRSRGWMIKHRTHIIHAAPWQRSQRRQGVAAAVPLTEVAAGLEVSPAVVLLPLAAAGLGAAGLRFAFYSQLEYITASMITRYVPKGNAQVIQLGGGTKEVFYMPKDTLALTAVGEDLNRGLMEQAGMQAGVPTVVRRQPATDLSFAPDGSADVVVSLRQLGSLAPAARQAALAEAARALKPGRPLVFIERLAEGGSPLRGLLGGGGAAVTLAEMEAMRGAGGGWSYVEWDVALQGQDPHVVGVAVRGEGGVPRSRAARAAAKQQAGAAAEQAPPKRAKGFS